MKNTACEALQNDPLTLLEGTPTSEVQAHLAECSDCRDARFELETMTSKVSGTASGFTLEKARLEQILNALEVANADATNDASGKDPSPVVKEDVKSAEVVKETKVVSLGVAQLPRAIGAKDRTGPMIAGLTTLALAAGVALSIGSSTSTSGSTGNRITNGNTSGAAPWSGTVASIGGAGGEVCKMGKGGAPACRAAEKGTTFQRGETVRTNARATLLLKMSEGTEIALARSSEIAFDEDKGRKVELLRGELQTDVAHLDGQHAEFRAPGASVEVIGTRFTLSALERTSRVAVSRGEVEVSTKHMKERVRRGEEATVDLSSERLSVYRTSGPTSETSLTVDAPGSSNEGFGELVAKKPGSKEEKKGSWVRVHRHIGGLEKLKSDRLSLTVVHRHIGGLENRANK